MRLARCLLFGSAFASTTSALSDADLADCFNTLLDEFGLAGIVTIETAHELNNQGEHIFEAFCNMTLARVDNDSFYSSSNGSYANESTAEPHQNQSSVKAPQHQSSVEGSHRRNLQGGVVLFPPQYPLIADVADVYDEPGVGRGTIFERLQNGDLTNR